MGVAAFVSHFGSASAALAHLKLAHPAVGGTTHTTTRARLITVGERIDEEIRQEITENQKPDKLAKADDHWLQRSFRQRSPSDGRANLEIITGRIEADAEPSKVFAVVRDQDGHAKQHVQALLRQSGRDLETKLRGVDCGPTGGLANGEEAAYALDPTRRTDVAPRALCATQLRTGRIHHVVALRIIAGAGGGGMNP
jgi:hypothetical protein